MQPYPERSKPHAVQLLVSLTVLVLLGAAYVAAMYALIDLSQVDTDREANDRDTAYAILHVGLLTGAAMIGFGVGKWLNGLGFAYATLFVLVLAVLMVVAQLSSYELACHGHNDLIRHWTC